MKNNNPCVSVIMPVYNGEQWLDESITSVLNQTFQNFELLLLNDGSTDQSLEILKKYATQDKRIRVFDNQNQGPGESLNFGIKKALAPYVCFIDQDDQYVPTYLEKMYDSITKYHSDFALCYGDYFNPKKGLKKHIDYRYYEEYVYDLTKKEEKERLFFHFVPQWTKMIKKDFLIQNHISFPSRHNKVHDVPFHLLCVWYAKSFSVVSQELYLHRVHEKQISHNVSSDFLTGFIESFKDLENHFYQYCPNEKAFISFALKLLCCQGTKEQNKYAQQMRKKYDKNASFVSKVRHFFFHKKVKNKKIIYRILCFQFKVKLK